MNGWTNPCRRSQSFACTYWLYALWSRRVPIASMQSMKKGLTILMLAALVVGCTSMQTTKPRGDELHERIRAGDLVDPGDRIRVLMSDGTKQTLEVFRVDEDAVHGRTANGNLVQADIDEIAALATEDFSILRSAGLGLGIFYTTIFALGALGLLLYGV